MLMFIIIWGELVMDKYPDLRISRTMFAIRNAFAELVQEKGFENLLVKDITTKANINRGTFYLHYKDKFDLLDQIEHEIIREIEGIVRKVYSGENSEYLRIDAILPVIVEIFKYFSENSTLINSILSLKGDNSFQLRIKNVIRLNLFENSFFQKVGQVSNVTLEIPQEYFITYIASTHIAILEEWLARGCIETPEEMSIIFSKLVFQGPFSVLGLKPNP